MNSGSTTAAPAAGQRLSQGLGELWTSDVDKRRFDVLIIGSGYGGSMAAAELAGRSSGTTGKPLRIGLLERGKEYLPGEFPSHFSELPGHMRMGQQQTGRVGGKHEGLFDLRLGEDVNALVANGLGGGSLINAGVLLKPKLTDLPPGDLHELVYELEQAGLFKEAKYLLGGFAIRNKRQVRNRITLHPGASNKSGLPKTEALSKLSSRAADMPPLSVAMANEANSAQVKLNQCTLCGDCMTGCNIGAKNSLDANLLELAKWREAEIYTGATVLSLRRSDKDDPHWRGRPDWVVRVVHTSPALQQREPKELHLYADTVILAAGTLGSSEILLRSRTDKLVFSSRLGERFSCNGDNIAAVAQMPEATKGCADEQVGLKDRGVGPTITGSITVPVSAKVKRPFRIQEFSVPGPLKPLFEQLVTTASLIHRMPEGDSTRHGAEGAGTDPLAVDSTAMGKTLLVGVIGHDDAAGSLHLPRPLRPRDRPAEPGTLSIHWPEARKARDLTQAHEELERRALDVKPAARLIANPMWRLLPPKLEQLVTQPRGPVLTVHPLGGCPMAKTAADGVVDRFGRVFDAGRERLPNDEPIHDGLLVLDGSIIPGSLGANPALTIAATALRAVRRHWESFPPASSLPPLRNRRMAQPDDTRPNAPLRPTEIEIVERLVGTVPLQFNTTLPQPHVVELTLAYERFHPEDLRTPMNRKVEVRPGHSSVIRIFEQSTWDEKHLRVASDAQREQHIKFKAELRGDLRFLHRERSSSLKRRLRTLVPWALNRGLRDIVQKIKEPNKTSAGLQDWLEYAGDLWRMASRAGEVRRFDYELYVGKVLMPWEDAEGPREGQGISGVKRLTYDRRANPWHQLTRLSLTRMPGMPNSQRPLLELDMRFLASQGFPLLRITGQQDHARALLDLACFGLLWLRVLISIHLWTFRKPDTPSLKEPDRLPRPIAGLPSPEITELWVDRMPGPYEEAIQDPRPAAGRCRPSLIDFCKNSGDVPVKIRLTRYLPPPTVERRGRPLVMLHGYSVSGNTFTHESLAPNSAAEFFCRQGREVWVVDLRTSTALATATYPWPMEQAALVDIPAALLHIRNATGKEVDVLAHCIGCVMLSMALLTDPRKVRSGVTQLSVDSWLTTEHLATLTAFNGAEPPAKGASHPCVHRVILSQKGPLLRYTDSNIFRAFVLQSARRLLMKDDYQFRPPREPKVADQLLDRLLASLPYPDADYDVENPLWPFKTTPWVASRHRMDALYGRDFDAANLSDETLEAIDDLFGPINLETVAQTIHFTRFQVITNQRGRGEFVTRRQLRERWSPIPTMIIHGQHNGLVDVNTQDLLGSHLAGAGVRLDHPKPDEGPYANLGHQDVLIGRDSLPVFEDLERFLSLKDDELPDPLEPEEARHVFLSPWIGPRIALSDKATSVVRLACMSHPVQGRATLCLFPVSQAGGQFKLGQNPAGVVVGDDDNSERWLFAQPAVPSDGSTGSDYLALLAYARDEVVDCEEAWPFIPQPTSANPPSGLRALLVAQPLETAKLLQQAQEWVKLQPTAVLQNAFVKAGALAAALSQHTATSPQYGTRFALASCQYPAGLMDGPVAQANLQQLADTTLEGPQVGFALLVGDQIYADATAGLMDPMRRDERYDQPHQKALRASGMRSLLRSMPVQMLLDDHEIVDNWEPTPEKVEQARPIDALRNRLLRHHGFSAFRRYQRMAHGRFSHSATADMHFLHAGFPFYLADTRTGRTARGSTVPQAQQSILSHRQEQRLQAWLKRHREAVKFVATPSLLLPRRLQTKQDPAGGARHSDAWDGFPASLERLLIFIAENGITNTVFLSGDEHHSLVAEIEITASSGRAAKVLSVHSSGLYAPFPFANGRPSDLVLNETFPQGELTVKVTSHLAQTGDGYAILHTNGIDLDVEFSRPGGAPPKTISKRLV
ncbi:alkaline phosphatase D family protein [Roseateles sp. P5_E4]